MGKKTVWKEIGPFEGDQKLYYDNLLSHLRRFKNNIFVETGTLFGNGIQCAIDAGFQKCISIEIHNHLYSKATHRFSEKINQGMVQLYLGNSETYLGEAIKNISEPITFWLDAHLSHNYGEKLAKNCPAIEELTAIKNHPIKNHTILIDDLNCFDKESHDNIPLSQIKNFLLSINSNYKFEYLDAARPGNILVAYV